MATSAGSMPLQQRFAVMPSRQIEVRWPDGRITQETIGQDWLVAASGAGVNIPTGCLGGSCGACEIDVNGKTVRACISTVPASKSATLTIEFATNPHW